MKIKRSSSIAAAEKSKQSYDYGPDRKSAMGHIKDAIDALTTIAGDGDEVAKDAIANLSVVLFDLKGN